MYSILKKREDENEDEEPDSILHSEARVLRRQIRESQETRKIVPDPCRAKSCVISHAVIDIDNGYVGGSCCCQSHSL